MLYPKTFYYKITDPNCTRSIKVDTDKCKTISDLKTQISHDLHISESDFQINNPLNEEKLSEIPSNTELTVNIFRRCYHIDFIFPDYSRIQIPNSYRMTVEEVLDYFAQKQLYFSTTTKRELQFTVSSHLLPSKKYPFIAIPILTPVHIKLPYQPVIITYGSKKFILSENETIGQASSEIKSYYPSCSLVELRTSSGQRIQFWLKLKSSEKYRLFVGFQVPFKSTDDTIVFTKKIDSLATVDDARREVSEELSKSGQIIGQEGIILYDRSHKLITGTRKKLETVQSLFNVFYFEIDKESTQPKLRKTIYKFRQNSMHSKSSQNGLRKLRDSTLLGNVDTSDSDTSITSFELNRPNKFRNIKSTYSSPYRRKSSVQSPKKNFLSPNITNTDLSDSSGSSSVKMILMFSSRSDESDSRSETMKTDEYNNNELSDSFNIQPFKGQKVTKNENFYSDSFSNAMAEKEKRAKRKEKLTKREVVGSQKKSKKHKGKHKKKHSKK